MNLLIFKRLDETTRRCRKQPTNNFRILSIAIGRYFWLFHTG